MKILLINPPSYLNNPSFKRTVDVVPHGILYVARSLMDAGHEVHFFDIFAEGLATDDVIQRLKGYQSEKFDLVGITAMSVQYGYVKWVSGKVKDILGDVPVVVGGALAIFSHKILLENASCDIAVTGEGEKTIVELAEQRPLATIRGIAYKDSGRVIVNPPADLIKDMDVIPYPAYELLPMDIYRRGMQFEMDIEDKNGRIKKEKFRYFCMSGGRGCPFDCNFCSRCFPGLRLRSVDSIVEEIKFFRRKYDFNSVLFFDELMLVGKKRILEFAEKIKELNIYWTANGRVEYFDPDVIRELKKSGCYQISFGIESGSQRLLDAMNKRQKVETAHRTLKDFVDAGLRANVQMIFGYPGENEESIAQTAKFFKDLPINVGFAILTPLPGSKLYRDVMEKGLIPKEEEYLMGLETGFNTIHLNLTEWTDEGFLKKREQLALNINNNTMLLKYGYFNRAKYNLMLLLKSKLISPAIRLLAKCMQNTRTADSEPLTGSMPVYVINVYGADLADETVHEKIRNAVKQIEGENTGKKIRMYASDYFISTKLAQHGFDIPWGKTLIADKTDSSLFESSDKVFYEWVKEASAYDVCSFKGVSLAAMMHDDYIRKFRDHLLIKGLCRKDRLTGGYQAHILFTPFPHYFRFADTEVNIVKIIPLMPLQRYNRLPDIKSMARKIYDVVLSLRRFGMSILKPAETGDDKLLFHKNIEKDSARRLLFVVTEPIGGKNCLDPLISMARAAEKDFNCDYRILVDNAHSLDYLKERGIGAQLITKSGRRLWKKREVNASSVMKKIALARYRQSGNSIEGLLFLTIASSNVINNLEDLFYRIEFCDSFIENYKPDAVMLYPDESYSGFAAASICKKNKIPTMMFFQSIISEHKLYSTQHTDSVAVYGTHGRDILLKLGFTPDKLILTGNPKLDMIPLRSKASDMRYAQDLLPDWDGRPLLVLATHLLVPMGELAVANFFSALKGEGTELFYPVIKLHPDDDLKSYERLLAYNLSGANVPLIKNCDLYALLNCADIVVTGASTVGAEAALFDKPVMTLNFSGTPFPVDYAKEGIAIEVHKKEEILSTLKKMTNDREMIADLSMGRRRFIERYAYKMDGKSGYRVIRALLNLFSPAGSQEHGTAPQYAKDGKWQNIQKKNYTLSNL